MTNTTSTYRLWTTLAPRPGGSRLFSAATMLQVPSFASIVPHVRRMEPGFAEVSVPKWIYVKSVEVLPPRRCRSGGSRAT